MPRKTQETRRIYEVFIASPGDVAAERSIAFDVIADLNRIYERQKKDYRLEVRAWERHTYPNVGLPQEVINQQISISECNIFIGVFWKRFGTPPGSKRPDDGRPYLSGTEEETEMAIKARKASPDQRPVIMLYRKSDSVTDRMEDDDYLQYAKVIEFFRECRAEGSHPALIKEFSGDQFRTVLRDHLLQVIADFESQAQLTLEEPTPYIRPTVEITTLRARLEKLDDVEIETLCLDYFKEVYGKFSRGLRRDEKINLLLEHCQRNLEEAVRLGALLPHVIDSEKYKDGTVWLIRVGLTVNPFAYWITEENAELLSSYQVQPQVLRSLDEEIRNAVNRRLIFFAPRGWGKTALCKLIAKSHYPLKDKDDILCIVCGRRELEKVIAYANNSLEVLDTVHYISIMQELILTNVRNVSQDKGALDKFSTNVPQGLEALTAIVHQQGFKSLMCLVDQVDEVGIAESQSEKMVQLLRPLMRVSWQTIPGMTFRYFLPSSVEPLLQVQNDIFNLGRYRVIHLKWTEEDLRQLIAQRLLASSNGLITSLGQLCEPGFAGFIDLELVRLAEGSPRATIWLANALIELHCQAENPPRLIQPATWEQVKEDWSSQSRWQFFGPPTQSEGFVLAGDRVYFQGEEVILSEKYDALLRCLIRAGERVCTKEELIKAGWPGDRPEGVTEEALTEATRRMKAELKKLGCDSRWVKTVRGRGYRLQKPERRIAEAESEGGLV